jgi:hypothetical protein
MLLFKGIMILFDYVLVKMLFMYLILTGFIQNLFLNVSPLLGKFILDLIQNHSPVLGNLI